jgi:hypothetical protein
MSRLGKYECFDPAWDTDEARRDERIEARSAKLVCDWLKDPRILTRLFEREGLPADMAGVIAAYLLDPSKVDQARSAVQIEVEPVAELLAAEDDDAWMRGGGP